MLARNATNAQLVPRRGLAPSEDGPFELFQIQQGGQAFIQLQ